MTSAVVRSIRGETFPTTRSRLLSLTKGRVVEGWDVSEFLARSLVRRRYADLRSVMSDLEAWLDEQG
jgi:hypothetical protein